MTDDMFEIFNICPIVWYESPEISRITVTASSLITYCYCCHQGPQELGHSPSMRTLMMVSRIKTFLKTCWKLMKRSKAWAMLSWSPLLAFLTISWVS